MQTDEQLYKQFLQGDAEAIECLVGRYKTPLTLFIYGYIKNKTDAEQLMIDSFAKLVVSAGQFRDKSSLKTYLFAIARNEALRYLKKNPHHLSLQDAGMSALADDCLQAHTICQENKTELYAAMAKLPTDYAQVLFLLYFEGLPYKDAAQVMGKNIKQITNLAYRAKKALKHQLEQEGFAYDG